MINQVVTAANGFKLSEIIQGYWRLMAWDMSAKDVLNFAKQHVDLGITSVDHADIYGNYGCESAFGAALALDPAFRHQLQIITKCDIKLATDKYPSRKINHYDTSATHITQSVDNSLANLRTDHIDLLLIHRPDPLMNADEVAETFKALKAAGKVLNFGVSNFSARQFELLQSRLDAPLVTNQIEINPMNMSALDDGTLDQLQTERVRPMVWSCLAGGEIFSSQTEQAQRLRAELHAIGDELGGYDIDQVIYAWLLKLPAGPLPILGTGNIQRIEAAVAATQLSLTNEQWFRIWVASKGHGVP
ncbi:aldo/keto reductase [Thaumasiovibrio sp. DFM-14]|uniref:aldo/keto reductase n=1 Tax=Thaumasiovibrio sp. DFM-14 TaxID=3384792 RepID=UPI0039A1B6E4